MQRVTAYGMKRVHMVSTNDDNDFCGAVQRLTNVFNLLQHVIH